MTRNLRGSLLVASMLVVMAFIGPGTYFETGNTAPGLYTLGVFVLEATILTALAGGSFGKLATRLRVVRYDAARGASVIATFVNQHQFFIERDNLVDEPAASAAADADAWDQIADPDAEPPGVEAGLQSLVDEVRIVGSN